MVYILYRFNKNNERKRKSEIQNESKNEICIFHTNDQPQITIKLREVGNPASA